MFKYFTYTGKREWLKILQDLIESYNNSYHRTIKMTPYQASEAKNEILFKNTYGVKNIEELFAKNKKKFSHTEGDTVRKRYKPQPFDKSYYPNWTDVVYNVKSKSKGPIKHMYNIEDDLKNQEKQRFYPEEIQKIIVKKYRIEKIIKRRVKNGNTQYYIKWLNYPVSFNSWVDSSDVSNEK